MPDELLTLEELTSRTGVSVRTVRFWTSRGLLPSPIKQGRSGYYSPEHVARLELVRELQAHGLTLAAIERYVDGMPEDLSADEVALQSSMLAPWQSEQPVAMTRAELDRRADRVLSDSDLGTLASLRVVRVTGEDRYDVSPSQLSVGLGLLDVGFPPEAAEAAAEVYLAHGRQIAHELYDVFRRLAWPAYQQSGATPETIQAVVERLKPLSVASLVAAYEQGMDETKRENISHRSRPARGADSA